MFLKAVQDTKATHVAVAFDVRAKTFRHEMYDKYKAHRKAMPDDLAEQLGDLKELLLTMNVAILQKPGFEADDIIGTVARKTSQAGDCNTVILSADRDCLQLVDECVELHLTKTGVTNMEVYTPDRVRAEFGIDPVQMIDLKALVGDKSDNIPGCFGIGEKTALALLKQFGTLEAVLEGTDNQKVCGQKELAVLSKTLATINCDVSIEYSPDSYAWQLPMSKEVFDEFKKRNFHSICNRKNLWQGGTGDEGGLTQLSFL